MAPFVGRWQDTQQDVLGLLKATAPASPPGAFWSGSAPGHYLVGASFVSEHRRRGIFAGISAHATLPLSQPPSAAFGWMLGLMGLRLVGRLHVEVPQASHERLSDTCVGWRKVSWRQRPVLCLDDLPLARAVFLDLTPRQYGLGTFKMDYAIDGPIPGGPPRSPARVPCMSAARSKNRDLENAEAERPSVHTSASFSHRCWIARAESQMPSALPRISRACHVIGPRDLERHNPILVGGDISGGESTLLQLFLRPILRPIPYATPNPKLFM